MACQPKFERAIPTECLITITSDIMGGRMNLDVMSKITWSVGCVLQAFGPEGPPATHEITIAMDSEEPTLQSVAVKLNASLQDNPIVNSFASQKDPAKAISPATLALLMQLAQLALTWFNNRNK